MLSQHLPVEESVFDKAIILNGYGVKLRYPDTSIFLTSEELQEAIQIAEDFRKFIAGRLFV